MVTHVHVRTRRSAPESDRLVGISLIDLYLPYVHVCLARMCTVQPTPRQAVSVLPSPPVRDGLEMCRKRATTDGAIVSDGLVD